MAAVSAEVSGTRGAPSGNPDVPEAGQLVRVRGQQWVVSSVNTSHQPQDEPATRKRRRRGHRFRTARGPGRGRAVGSDRRAARVGDQRPGRGGDLNLVFCHEDGSMYTSRGLNWHFNKMTKKAGIGHWHAHEGRHTAVSIMSSNGVPIQEISDTVGHKSTHVTETVYRHVIVPAIRGGATIMDDVFGTASGA
jgi:integrase